MSATCEECGGARPVNEVGLCTLCSGDGTAQRSAWLRAQGLPPNTFGRLTYEEQYGPSTPRRGPTCENCGAPGALDQAGQCVICSTGRHAAGAARWARRCESCGQGCHIVDDTGRCITCSPTATPRPGTRCDNCGVPGPVDETGLCARCGSDPIIARSVQGRRAWNASVPSPTAPPPPPSPEPRPQQARKPARCEGCGGRGPLDEDGVCRACAGTTVYRVLNGAGRALGWIGRHRP